MAILKYPFVPKSTAYLKPGQFWSIPLDDGRFACGRVIQLKYNNAAIDTRLFLAGLMDWIGKVPPSAGAIAGCKVLEQGSAHIKTIRENAGMIFGWRSLAAEGIQPQHFLSQSPGQGCMLMHGYEILRRATAKEQTQYEVFPTWGYKVIKLLAEKLF